MNVRDVLLGAPDAIRTTSLDLWRHKERRDAALLAVKLREADVALGVARTPHPEDAKKKQFTNDSERDGETRARLATDTAYAAARREADEEKATCARIEAALEYHANRLRAAIALAGAIGNLDLEFRDSTATAAVVAGVQRREAAEPLGNGVVAKGGAA